MTWINRIVLRKRARMRDGTGARQKKRAEQIGCVCVCAGCWSRISVREQSVWHIRMVECKFNYEAFEMHSVIFRWVADGSHDHGGPPRRHISAFRMLALIQFENRKYCSWRLLNWICRSGKVGISFSNAWHARMFADGGAQMSLDELITIIPMTIRTFRFPEMSI